jgi:hypothetical protein
VKYFAHSVTGADVVALGLRRSVPVEEVMCLIYSQICVSVLLIDTFIPTIAKKIVNVKNTEPTF